jgi:pSer/pThr/pTyr-binding forkhead associated (FHA) protein
MTDNSSTKERHVLVVNDGKRRAIALEAAAYSVGRDPSTAIVLNADTVSRQHAMLMRLPVPGTGQYRYRLIDGNSQGKPSANGVFVNDKQCRTHDLNPGDLIRFGQTLEASYLTVLMGEAEFTNYLESIAYQSIKSDTINAKETLVAACLSMEDIMSVSTSTLPETSIDSRQRKPVAPWAETLHEGKTVPSPASQPAPRQSPQRFRLWMIAIPGALVAVSAIVGLGMLASRGQFSKSSAAPAPAQTSVSEAAQR